MSTKSSIKYKEARWDAIGYHLYSDVMDQFDEGEPPIYLELRGVQAEMATAANGGAIVNVTIPADIARELGLLPTDHPRRT